MLIKLKAEFHDTAGTDSLGVSAVKEMSIFPRVGDTIDFKCNWPDMLPVRSVYISWDGSMPVIDLDTQDIEFDIDETADRIHDLRRLGFKSEDIKPHPAWND